MDRVARRGGVILFGTAALVYLLDRSTKLWAERAFASGPVDVIPGVLTFRYVSNSGGAFSLGQSAPWFFAAATIVVSALIAATAFRAPERPDLGRARADPRRGAREPDGSRRPRLRDVGARGGLHRRARLAGVQPRRQRDRDRRGPAGGVLASGTAAARVRSPTMAPEELRASPGRLDAVVAELTGAPRADVQRAIVAGGVLVDGSPRPKSFRLLGGERLTVDLPGAPTIGPEGPPVPVRYEDADLLVVAKPAGLLTHPTAARPTGTLVNRLLGMEVPLAASGGPLRPGIVHRLDAGTSGLLVVAKTDRAFAALKAMFARHAVERRYLALVPTARRRPGRSSTGCSAWGPARPAGGPLRPGIVHRLDAGTSGLMLVARPTGLRALRRCSASRVDRRYLALVRATPNTTASPSTRRSGAAPRGSSSTGRGAARRDGLRGPGAGRGPRCWRRTGTGRTHQIRVHLAAIGHPILGDRAYGGAGDAARAPRARRARSCTRGGSPSCIRSRASGSRWRSRCRRTWRRPSSAPAATCNLDAARGPAYVGGPANHSRVSFHSRRGTCG